ncbi:MAG: alpha/beta fold hydrolase [Desulfovibrionales bacterium]
MSILLHGLPAGVYQMALSVPVSIRRIAVLDIVPALELLSRPWTLLRMGYVHWFFFLLPRPVPEKLLGLWIQSFLKLAFRMKAPGAIEGDAFHEYLRCYASPGGLFGPVHDFRTSAASLRKKQDSKMPDCPVLVLWGRKSPLRHVDVSALWRPYASDLHVDSLPGGHFLPEECPRETAETLGHHFLKSVPA